MFKDRKSAGLLLIEKLKGFKGNPDVVVFSIPRGGVILGKIISQKLGLKLSAIVIKKIGAPHNPELAIGAVGPKGVVFWDEEIIKILGLDEDRLHVLKELKESERKEREDSLKIKIPEIKGKIAIVVDDGVATGATVITAAKFLQKAKASKVILATPVISDETYITLKKYFDKIIYLLKPITFRAVGEFYESFPQVSDEEVKKLIND